MIAILKKFLPIISFTILIPLTMIISDARYSNPQPPFLFWFFIISLSLLLFLQIIANTTNTELILLQILILSFNLRTIFVSSGIPLVGVDSYVEYGFMQDIIKTGYWRPDVYVLTANYPLIYLYGDIYHTILGVSTLWIAKWMPISFFPISTLIMFLLTKKLFGSKSGIYVTLTFSLLYIHLLFHTMLHRESLAIYLFLTAMYTYFMGIFNKNTGGKFWMIFTMIGLSLVFAHHLSSFMMLIFITLYLPVKKIFDNFNKIHANLILPEISVGIYIISLLGYWAYLKKSPFQFFDTILKESPLINQSVPAGGMVIPSLSRYKILFFGEIFYGILFGILALIATLFYTRLRHKNLTFIWTLLIFSGVSGILMVMTLLGKIMPREGMGLGSRFETFVYIGALPLATSLGLLEKNRLVQSHTSHSRHLKCFILIVLLSFILLNIYRIPPYLYSNQPIIPGEARPLITTQEAIAIYWLGYVPYDHLKLDPSNGGPTRLTTFMNKKVHGSSNKKYILHSNLVPWTTANYNTPNSIIVYSNSIGRILLGDMR